MPDPNPNPDPTPDPVPDPAAKPAAESDPSPSKPVRPEGLADDYWDAEKGVVLDKLLADHKTLAEAKAEADKRAAEVPEDITAYKAELPEDFKLPEGMKFEPLPEGDPVLTAAREYAKSAGLTPKEFKGLVALQMQSAMAEEKALQEASAAERKKLGDKGQARIDAVTTFLQTRLGNDHANALVPMIFTAKQLEAYEGLIEVAKGGAPKFNQRRDGEGEPEMSDEEWNAMSQTDKIAWSRAHQKTATKR